MILTGLRDHFRRTPKGTELRQPNGTLIQVRGLTSRDLPAHIEHLQRLTPEDRRARFHSAMSDAAIAAYSGHLDWHSVYIFGVFVRGELRAVGELIPIGGDQAELSLSVERAYQRAGFGKVLSLTLMIAARKAGLKAVRMVYFLHNDKMRALARDMGAKSELDAGVMEGVVTFNWGTAAPRGWWQRLKDFVLRRKPEPAADPGDNEPQG